MLSPHLNEPNLFSKENFAATECTLYLGVISILSSVIQGTYTESVLDEWVDPTWNGSIDGDIRPLWGPEKGVFTPRQIYQIPRETRDIWTENGTKNFPYSDIQGVATMVDGVVSDNRTETGKLIFNSDISVDTCPGGSPNQDIFACVVAAVAEGVMRTFRNSAFYRGGGFDESDSDFIGGKVYARRFDPTMYTTLQCIADPTLLFAHHFNTTHNNFSNSSLKNSKLKMENIKKHFIIFAITNIYNSKN